MTDSGEDSNQPPFSTGYSARCDSCPIVGPGRSNRSKCAGCNFAERESHAAYFLQEQDMNRYDAVNYISHGIAKRSGAAGSRPTRGVDEESVSVEENVGGDAKTARIERLLRQSE